MHAEAEQFLNVDRVGRNSDAFTGLVGALEMLARLSGSLPV